ncbi:hypothetical protein [Mesorhizobium sp. M8A.F.Ca.ET.165.01.1.1]|uniref:hypothetical protein n=1 Tax=Mesorhizobium sp. M8A.F.Ca.ET.165.01.1.1 TaxID=2563960 RepID=UPI00109386DF|nr:hypothetical protein [Mesorhizobium sp. M8A.F.Ca.ET.165.01.1.1]TGT34958.1 hypothetical protein EN808_34970 [Mesorhizobium sp. M8A.F.Ca.ET.165.01.1.1]
MFSFLRDRPKAFTVIPPSGVALGDSVEFQRSLKQALNERYPHLQFEVDASRAERQHFLFVVDPAPTGTLKDELEDLLYEFSSDYQAP